MCFLLVSCSVVLFFFFFGGGGLPNGSGGINRVSHSGTPRFDLSDVNMTIIGQQCPMLRQHWDEWGWFSKSPFYGLNIQERTGLEILLFFSSFFPEVHFSGELKCFFGLPSPQKVRVTHVGALCGGRGFATRGWMFRCSRRLLNSEFPHSVQIDFRAGVAC